MFLEAIACGLPVIAADCALAEIVAKRSGRHVAVAGLVAQWMRKGLRLVPGRPGMRTRSAFCCRRSSIRSL